MTFTTTIRDNPANAGPDAPASVIAFTRGLVKTYGAGKAGRFARGLICERRWHCVADRWIVDDPSLPKGSSSSSFPWPPPSPSYLEEPPRRRLSRARRVQRQPVCP